MYVVGYELGALEEGSDVGRVACCCASASDDGIDDDGTAVAGRVLNITRTAEFPVSHTYTFPATSEARDTGLWSNEDDAALPSP